MTRKSSSATARTSASSSTSRNSISACSARSIRLDAGIADEFSPSGELRDEEAPELLRGARLRVYALRRDRLACLFAFHGFPYFRCEACDVGGWRTARGEDAVPGPHLVAREALLGDRWHAGRERMPLA